LFVLAVVWLLRDANERQVLLNGVEPWIGMWAVGKYATKIKGWQVSQISSLFPARAVSNSLAYILGQPRPLAT